MTLIDRKQDTCQLIPSANEHVHPAQHRHRGANEAGNNVAPILALLRQ